MAKIPGLKVVRSSVEGYGVITTRFRARGSVIADVDGVLWREGERRDDRYSLYLAPGVFFDMVDQTRWVNHSCEPNVVVEAGVTRAGNGWAQLQALRDVEAGEELFYDYALPVELKEPCFCRTPSCRGWIVEKPEAGMLISPPQWAGRPVTPDDGLGAARPTPRRGRLRSA